MALLALRLPAIGLISFYSVVWHRVGVVFHVPAIYVRHPTLLIKSVLLIHLAEELRLVVPSLVMPHWTYPIAM